MGELLKYCVNKCPKCGTINSIKFITNTPPSNKWYKTYNACCLKCGFIIRSFESYDEVLDRLNEMSEEKKGLQMTPNEYQELAMRTKPKNFVPYSLLINSAMGLSGEAGEFTDILKKIEYQGHEYDYRAKEHLKKELGDILWYVALACDSLGTSMETVMEMNIDKLAARYPDGFDSYRSTHRKDGDI